MVCITYSLLCLRPICKQNLRQFSNHLPDTRKNSEKIQCEKNSLENWFLKDYNMDGIQNPT